MQHACVPEWYQFLELTKRELFKILFINAICKIFRFVLSTVLIYMINFYLIVESIVIVVFAFTEKKC